MCSRRPAIAAIGKPLAIALPSVVRSGITPADRLIAAEVVAEAGDDLVEDQQRALAVAQRRAGLRGSPGCGQQPGRVVRDRLDDDRGDLLGVRGEHARSTSSRSLKRQTRVASIAASSIPAELRVAPADHLGRAQDVAQHVVVKAVVAALELDDLLAAGDAAGEADRVVGRLRAAVADERLLGARARARRSCARARPRPRSRRRRTGRVSRIAVADALGHRGVRVARGRSRRRRRGSRRSGGRRGPTGTRPRRAAKHSRGSLRRRQVFTPPGMTRGLGSSSCSDAVGRRPGSCSDSITLLSAASQRRNAAVARARARTSSSLTSSAMTVSPSAHREHEAQAAGADQPHLLHRGEQRASPSTGAGRSAAAVRQPQRRSSSSDPREQRRRPSSPRAAAIRDSTTIPNATASPCSSGP